MDSILIVDDERGIRETLRAVMEDEGFVADAVATGEECLKALGRRAYGCILLDVWLPGNRRARNSQTIARRRIRRRRRDHLRSRKHRDRCSRH